ncbi:MAG: sensor histidine kinase [Limnochordia bacterium]|nr:sensor histidine kinase [Limnochordia bacterium]
MRRFELFWSRLAKKAEIHTIRTKLILSFLVIALIPLGIMAVFSYQTYYGSLTQSVTEYSHEVVSRMAKDLDEYFSDLEVLLNRDQDFYMDQLIKLVDGNDFNNRKYVFRIWEDLNNLYRVKPGVEEISLVFAGGNRLSNYGLYTLDFASFRREFQSHLQERGIAILGPRRNFLNRTVVTMVKPYTSPTAPNAVFMTADINLDRLANITDVRLGTRGYVFVADELGRIIYHPSLEELGTVSGFYRETVLHGFADGFGEYENERFFLTTGYSSVTGWSVVSVAYADEIGAQVAPIQRITFVVIALILVGVVLLAIYVSHALSRPIKELQNLTKRAANHELSVHIDPQGNDEIAMLGHSFNKMILRIQELMEENVREQKLLRKLEMESLDNQIKPHFIYNTLDLIIGQLESNQNEQASSLIEALGSFFRLSLSKGREIVPIASEVEHVRNYLFIQQLRHGDEYEYEIAMDKDIADKFIPRLLLQPLVENAIYHGILRANRQGKIRISGYQEADGDIVFEIQDDGAGLEPDKLQDINEVLRGERSLQNEKEYFGLRNVNKRAQLMFGEEYGVVLASEVGQGTKAILRIKAIKEDPNVEFADRRR